MLLLSENARLGCSHKPPGIVSLGTKRNELVRVDGARVLVATDPENCTMKGCILSPPLIPCTLTGKVETGYSTLVRIDGRAVCRDDVKGMALLGGSTRYTVSSAGQSLVSERE